jgi:hypothetical protein
MVEMQQKLLSRIALGLALVFGGMILLRALRLIYLPASIAIGFGCILAGLYFLVLAAIGFSKRALRDPYSLEALEEIDRRDQNQPIEHDGKDMDAIYCPGCQEVWPSKYNSCPNCGRRF